MSELTEITNLLNQMFSEQDAKMTMLEESLADKVAALDASGWRDLDAFGKADEGLDLNTLHTLSERLREMAASNPLHVRGAQLRFSYVFGEGLDFQGLKPAARAIVDNPYNKETLFSVDAYETLNLASFADGNVIVIYDQTDKLFTLVPIHEITGVACDPNDDGKIRYIKRSRNGLSGNQRSEWIPLSRWKKTVGSLPNKVSDADNDPISKTKVAYVKRSHRQAGWTWGIPDSMAAAVYAMAYSDYLQNNAKLVKALSMIAWSLTKTTKEGVSNAAAQVVVGGVGGTAVNTTGNAVSSVGVPSAQVNMNNGQPLAALVATTFGVSVIALLSSPGATGGSYGAATTLGDPTTKVMQAVQDSWRLFFAEIFADLGSTKATLGFPSIETDPAYRELQSITTAHSFGLLHDDEAREGALKVLRVPKLHDELPPKPVETPQAAAQGVSGPVPGGTDQDVTNHDGDESA